MKDKQNAIGAGVRACVATCAALMALVTFGQTVGKVRFMVDPATGSSFVLDHKFRMQQREVELSVGPHHFTFWAPERRMVDTTVTVVEGRTKDIVLRLPYSDEYRTFQRELQEEKKRRVMGLLLPTVATVGTGILAGISYSKYNKAHQQLETDQALYNSGSDPLAIQNLKDVVIPSHKSDFQDRKSLFYITAGAFAVVAAGSVYTISRTLKRTPPKFHDAERVKFDGLVWLPQGRSGYFLTGLHIELR